MLGCTETNCPKTSTARLAAAATTQTAFISLYYLGSLQPATSPSDLLPHLSSQPIPLPVLSSSTPIPLPPIPLPFPSPPPLPNPTLPRRALSHSPEDNGFRVWSGFRTPKRSVKFPPPRVPTGRENPCLAEVCPIISSLLLPTSPPPFPCPSPPPAPKKTGSGISPAACLFQINIPLPQWHPQPVPQLPPLCAANSDSAGTRPSSSVRPTYADTIPSIS